jgi:peptide/nickel transport system permease protein
MTAAAVLAVVVLGAVFAPLLATDDPGTTDLSIAFTGPSAEHWLGGDGSGRDVFSRLLHGAGASLSSGLLAVAVALLLGVPAGMAAGYFRGWTDRVADWVADLLLAVPAVVVLLAVVAAAGNRLWIAMAALGVLTAPGFFRLTRAAVADVRHHLYVDVARVFGLGDVRILASHVWPVIAPAVVLQTFTTYGTAILLDAGLAFLGLGDMTRPSWGGMLNDAFTSLYRAPNLVWAPGIALTVTIAALLVLGAAIADAISSRRGARAVDVPDAPGQTAAPVVRIASTQPTQPTRPASGGPLLQVRDLHVGYGGRDVVHGVGFDLADGEVLGLVGESGAGKSQIALSIAGLLPPAADVRAGAITLRGQELAGAGENVLGRVRGRRIGYVPQEPLSNLDPSFTIGSQLTEPLRLAGGLGRTGARDRALELLDAVGIVDPERTFAAYPHEISGGMAQRVLIAGAISGDPELLIADEPTTALDVTVQAEVLDLFRQLGSKRRLAILLVTHDFGVVADLCDRVAVVRRGEIVEESPVRELFAAPQHPYTRSLLEATLDGAPPRGAWTPPVPAQRVGVSR